MPTARKLRAEDEPTPKPRRERTENAAKRRKQLLAATARSIVERGLAKTTLATVSAESGLSQGVVVFYFKNKARLFAEVLRQNYEIYQRHWQTALQVAGDDPVEQLAALIRADFDPVVCNSDTLVIWYNFWGEANARPLYAEISEAYDNEKARAMLSVCTEVLEASGRPCSEAAEIGAGIEALTDGMWLRIYLSNGALTPKDGYSLTAKFVATMFPEHAARLLPAASGSEEG